ncbi:MAG: phenylalanine--tRNA ligase subunit beta, partial [Myxococcota bacterium]|nr:phenylalanine--tRNA ligase subunit beta [Myxococcota bacterium]
PLEAAGIHSLGAAIDATNLSNIEFGQPTHTFDADTIKGAIRVRESEEGEMAWPLFAEKAISLPVGSLVIADDEKILAIAGVIGCEESKTTTATKRIVLESACFEPVSVRKTARALGIHTTSVARFERGADPELVLVGAGRVVHLLEMHGWKRTSETTLVGDWVDPVRMMEVLPHKLNAFLGTELSEGEIALRLERYGFRCLLDAGSMHVRTPPHRLWDVDRVADLYEEIAKSVGYNNTPISLPMIDRGAVPSEAEDKKEIIDELLVGMGFYEVITDGFYGNGLFSKLGLPESHVLNQHVETLNALERGYSFLKNNALLQAVSAVSKNVKRHFFHIKMFEWTRVFIPNSTAENGVCSERKLLWGAVCGEERPGLWTNDSRKSDILFLKGVVEELGTLLRLPLVLEKSNPQSILHDTLHPYRQASIRLHGDVVGILGEIHPDICLRFKLKKQRPCYFEIDEAALFTPSQPLSYQVPDATQPLSRTISFALPQGLQAGDIQIILDRFCSQSKVNDIYPFEEDGQPWRSITYEVRFRNADGTLSADFVNNELMKMIAAVETSFGKIGVYQR